MVRKILFALILLIPALAHATITHGGSNAAPTAAGGSSSATPAIPAGAGTGDAMIVPAWVKGDNEGAAITTPAGWTLLHTVTQTGTGTHVTGYVFCKVHDGSETNPVLATTGTGTGDNVGGEVYYIESDGTGFDCANIEAHANQLGAAAATGLTHPSLTITTANTYVLAVAWKPECESCVFNTLATGGLGWTEATDNSGTVGDDWYMKGDYVIQTTAANISAGSWTATSGDESLITASIIISLQEIPGAATPGFDSGPTLDACDATSCTFDYDANADADHVWGMCLSTAESTPTGAAIKAGTGSNGDNDEASTGAADTISITLTDSPVFPIYNCHFVAEEGTDNFSSVVSVLSVMPAAPADMAFWPILSIGSGSPCEAFNDATAPDIVANDWLLSDDATSPSDYALTVANDCQYSYTGDTSPQSVLDTAVYDASVGGWHAEDIDVFFNNTAPVCDNEETIESLQFLSVAMDALDLNGVCTDPDTETLTYAVTVGSINSGLTLTGATGIIDGTPDTEDESGNVFTVTATDAAGEESAVELLIWVTDDSVLAPDVVGDTVPEALGELDVVRGWLDSGEQLTATFSNSDTVPSGDIISQDPAAAGAMTATSALEVVVSLGPVPVASEIPTKGLRSSFRTTPPYGMRSR